MAQNSSETAALYRTTNSKMRILPPDGHLGQVTELIKNPLTSILALDFDQTITHNVQISPGKKELRVRGGEKTKEALFKYVNSGGKVIVITAQEPRPQVMVNLSQELDKLGISAVFGVEPWDKKIVLDLIKSWGDNKSLSFKRLTQKLATLIVLSSLHRYVADIARLGGPLMTSFNPTKTKVEYFLQCLEEDNPNKGDWSAKQTIPVTFPSPPAPEILQQFKLMSIDTIDAWVEYLNRTQSWRASIDRRTRDQLRADGDDGKPEYTLNAKDKYSYICRLFLSENEFITTEGGELVHRPLTATELQHEVASLLREANISEKYIQRTLQDPVQIINFNGVLLARYSNLFASAYNKPYALDVFVRDFPERNDLYFVDDNSDNAWNMYYHFAQHEVKGVQTNHVVTSYWFTPPEGGKDEKFHAPFRSLLSSVAASHQNT